MVIKDILDKVGGSDPQNPQVKQLREKLARLQNKPQENPPTPQETPSPQQPPPQVPKPQSQAPKRQTDADIEALAQASENEQREFAQFQDPNLKIIEERTHKLVARQIGELIELSTDMNKRVTKIENEKRSTQQEMERLEKRNEEVRSKMEIIDQRLEKFMGLYEIITNQYNPFAQGTQGQPPMQMPEPSATPNLQVTDPITGAQSAVPIEQGEVSSENAEKITKLLAELEGQEKDLPKLDADEFDAMQVREEEIRKKLVAELHQMLEGFENRLKQYLDDSVQTKLHETMGNLENVLNTEIEQAVKEQVDGLKENESIIESALQELESLGDDSPEPEQFKAAEEQVAEHVHNIDDQIRAIPPSLFFRMQDGRILKSKKDLLMALQTMPDRVFHHHVSGERNDFADWLELALKDADGGKLRGQNKNSMIHILNSA